eukprot:1142646-Pelagomonas_calceolata.AAC.5
MLIHRGMAVEPILDDGIGRYSRLHNPPLEALPSDLLDLSGRVPTVKSCVGNIRGGADSTVLPHYIVFRATDGIIKCGCIAKILLSLLAVLLGHAEARFTFRIGQLLPFEDFLFSGALNDVDGKREVWAAGPVGVQPQTVLEDQYSMSCPPR